MKINKKKFSFILIAICLVGLIGLGVSYSYYLASIRTSNEENKSTDISTLGITSVVMDMQGKISSNGAYPGHKMVKEVVVRGIGAENAKPANASIRITPELGDFSEDVTWKLYKSEEAITCSSVEHTDGREYYDESTCNIPASASLVLEGSSVTKYKNIVVSPNTETKYYLVVEYLNKENEDQSSQMGKSFSIDIGIGEKVPSMSDKIAYLAKTDTVNLASDDADKNVRYIGANPNNYVYFNCSDYSNPTANTCELWRIIGVFNNVTKGDGSKENLVKIIRADSLGNYSWDSKNDGVGTSTGGGSNDWTDSQLMMMLNPTSYLKSGYTNFNDIISSGSQQLYSKMGSYYNGVKGCSPAAIASGASFSCTEVDFTLTGLKNDTTRNAIEEVVWNLGGTDRDDSPTASMFYTAERGKNVYTGRPTTWTGKIGLMYPSDYGYATSGGTNKDRAACLAKELLIWNFYDFSDCTGNDYLYNSSLKQWTMTTSLDGGSVFNVMPNGIVTDGMARADFAVRPALFLKSSILLDKGTGAKSNPYTLSVN